MKRIISLLAAVCMALCLLPVTGIAATELTLTKTVIGNSGAVIAVSGGSGTIAAESSDPEIAEVSVSGSTVTLTGVEGKKGVVTVTVTRGSSTASIEAEVGYTTFRFSGRSVTVYEGSDLTYEVVGIEQASETEYLGTEGTGEMTASADADGNPVYTVAEGYELCVAIKKKGGIYSFNGTTTCANIAVKKEATKDATLILDGLDLKSQFTSAITIKKDSTACVYINTLLGTQNKLADSAVNNADTYGPTADGGDGSNQYYAESAVIKGKTDSNLTISGKGKLTVTAAAKNGVKVGANAYLTVNGGELTVNALNSALSTENEMLISGGTLSLTTSGGDGIKAADDTDTIGTAYITGGSVTVNAADEGILVRKDLYISGGTLNITAGGDAIKAENVDETAGDITISGGGFTINSTGDGISAFNLGISGGTYGITCANGYTNTSYNGDTMASAKCIKSELETVISGGTFTLSAPDDAIHSDGNVTIEGGVYQIRTRDDGVHADQALAFGIRGADDSLIDLSVLNCYEGLEGADIYLNSGHCTVNATDDTVNAANKNTSNYHFTINVYGGVHRLYTSGGDGVDSNGGCYFRGGDLEVFAKSNTSNDPLDSEDTLALYNGVVLGCGQNAMQGAPTAGIYVQFTNLSVTAGASIVIKDGSGNVLKSTTAYFAGASCTANYIIFSHPALVSGSTYYCYVNGSSSAKTGTATGSHVDNTPWADLDSGDTNVYERVTSMGEGSRYVITNASAASSVYTLGGSTAVSAVQSTLSTVTGGYSFGTLSENNTWYMDAAGHIYNTVGGVNYYLKYTQSSSGWSSTYTLGKTTEVSQAAGWTVNASGSAAQLYATAASSGGPGGGPGGPGQSSKLYLYYSSGWKLTTTASTVYIYAPAVAQAALTGPTYYVAENDEGFGMSDITASTSILYRSSRTGASSNVSWSSSHISWSWEPAFDSAVNGVYVMTVKYDGIAFGTVTVRIVGEDQSITVTFVGDYTGTVELAAGDTVTLPTAPSGYYYTFFVNGLEFNGSEPLYQNTTITVVLNTVETPQPTKLGDVNCDGQVSMADLSALAAYLLGKGSISSDGLLNADVNNDGAADVMDLPLIYQLTLIGV